MRRRVENSHVQLNLVHKLYRVQRIGRQDVSYFKGIITPEEEAASKLKNLTKSTWFKLTANALCNVLYQVRFTELDL